MVVQALSNFESVYGVRPIEILGHEFGFIALHGADAVPDQRRLAVLQGDDFVYAFLDVVLAKVALAASGDLAHIVGAEDFGHGKQLHAIGTACAGCTRGCDAGLYGVKVVS